MNSLAGEVADVPALVVTITLTVPVPAGEVAVIEVAVLAVTVAVAVPNSTLRASARLLPVMVTTVPPTSGPAFGLTPLTAGMAT